MTGTSRRAFSVAVFCRHEGEVLLVRHRRLGTWLPVGGEIEPGETPLEAARRELREETGLEGRFPAGLGVDGTPPGLIGYEEHLAGSKGLHMNFAFVADVAARELDDPRPAVRAAALDAAATLGKAAAVGHLARSLGDPSALVRRRAAVLLGFAPGAAVDDALASALADRDAGVARAAATALAGRPSARAQGALAKALDHHESEAANAPRDDPAAKGAGERE